MRCYWNLRIENLTFDISKNLKIAGIVPEDVETYGSIAVDVWMIDPERKYFLISSHTQKYRIGTYHYRAGKIPMFRNHKFFFYFGSCAEPTVLIIWCTYSQVPTSICGYFR
jgi:hypothetical protein